METGRFLFLSKYVEMLQSALLPRHPDGYHTLSDPEGENKLTGDG